MLENIQNGKGYQKLLELVKNQGGEISYIEDVSKFQKAKYIEPITSNENGYIHEIDAKEVGKLASDLGAGRIKKEDNIDYSVGIVFNKKVADKINEEEIIAYIHANEYEKLQETKNKLLEIVKISSKNKEKEKNILEIITK